MAGMLEYKCPCCDGAIQFDSATQKMKCPYCDTEFDVDTLKGYDEELKDEKPSEMEWTTPGGSWAEGETAGLHTYSCKSCGGEIVGDDTMAASACPFCGNPIVLTGQFAGALRPDLIIPFKLDKKAAKAKLQEHLKGKTLLPRVFRSQNHIDEVKGVYVPFWLFDSDADAQLRFTATRTRSWSDSKYDYTETNYYSVRRDGTLGFDAVPVDGSSKIEDDLMESIEPFAMQDAIPFQTAYLAGYVADKYDVTAEDSIERANRRIRRSTEETFQQTVTGYDSVKVENSSIQLPWRQGKVRAVPGLAAEHQLAGRELPVCHERTDRQIRGRPARGQGRCPQVDAGPYGCPFRRVLRRDVAAVAGTDPVKEGRTMKKTSNRLRSLFAALAALVLAVLAGRSGICGGGRLCRPVLPHESTSADVLTAGRGQRAGGRTGRAEPAPELRCDHCHRRVAGKRGVPTAWRPYADDLYDYCQYGYGPDMDGVLLLVSVGDRKWHISTCGYGITAFTDAGIQYLGEQMTPFMADGRLRRRLPHLCPVVGYLHRRCPGGPPL